MMLCCPSKWRIVLPNDLKSSGISPSLAASLSVGLTGNTEAIHAHPHCRDDSVSAGEVKCMEISCALRRLVFPQLFVTILARHVNPGDHYGRDETTSKQRRHQAWHRNCRCHVGTSAAKAKWTGKFNTLLAFYRVIGLANFWLKVNQH